MTSLFFVAGHMGMERVQRGRCHRVVRFFLYAQVQLSQRSVDRDTNPNVLHLVTLAWVPSLPAPTPHTRSYSDTWVTQNVLLWFGFDDKWSRLGAGRGARSQYRERKTPGGTRFLQNTVGLLMGYEGVEWSQADLGRRTL